MQEAYNLYKSLDWNPAFTDDAISIQTEPIDLLCLKVQGKPRFESYLPVGPKWTDGKFIYLLYRFKRFQRKSATIVYYNVAYDIHIQTEAILPPSRGTRWLVRPEDIDDCPELPRFILELFKMAEPQASIIPWRNPDFQPFFMPDTYSWTDFCQEHSGQMIDDETVRSVMAKLSRVMAILPAGCLQKPGLYKPGLSGPMFKTKRTVNKLRAGKLVQEDLIVQISFAEMIATWRAYAPTYSGLAFTFGPCAPEVFNLWTGIQAERTSPDLRMQMLILQVIEMIAGSCKAYEYLISWLWTLVQPSIIINTGICIQVPDPENPPPEIELLIRSISDILGPELCFRDQLNKFVPKPHSFRRRLGILIDTYKTASGFRSTRDKLSGIINQKTKEVMAGLTIEYQSISAYIILTKHHIPGVRYLSIRSIGLDVVPHVDLANQLYSYLLGIRNTLVPLLPIPELSKVEIRKK